MRTLEILLLATVITSVGCAPRMTVMASQLGGAGEIYDVDVGGWYKTNICTPGLTEVHYKEVYDTADRIQVGPYEVSHIKVRAEQQLEKDWFWQVVTRDVKAVSFKFQLSSPRATWRARCWRVDKLQGSLEVRWRILPDLGREAGLTNVKVQHIFGCELSSTGGQRGAIWMQCPMNSADYMGYVVFEDQRFEVRSSAEKSLGWMPLGYNLQSSNAPVADVETRLDRTGRLALAPILDHVDSAGMITAEMALFLLNWQIISST